MTHRLWIGSALAGVTLAGVAMLVAPPPAHACGGFFCNNSQPVNQQAERIVFSHNEDGTVTAIIQIQYSGPSERFAWMLPVAGNPDVAVSSNAAFQRLQFATNPQYTLNRTIEGTCGDGFGRGGGFPTAAAGDGGAASDREGGGVTVVNAGSVGPYDFVVINVEPSATDHAAIAVQWLQDNGYDISDFGAERIGPYLEAGMNLLAFRLTKGNDTGSIRPVMITFGSGLPSIPIRPTAVAATDDMGVMVWVLGAARAVPVNYMSLELNEALIDWINPNNNYNDVVTRAANEAGGQGFVTEMAGQAAPMAETIFAEWERSSWETYRTRDWTGLHGQLLNDVVNQFNFDGMRDAIEATVPVPAGVAIDDLVACVGCYYNWSVTTIAGFDPAAFLAAVQTHVIEPMERTRELFTRRPYMTRLYTTMSADEMTKDPVFDFNAGLGDYSNQHTADQTVFCSPMVELQNAPWRVTLPNGEIIRGVGQSWPFSTGDMPSNSRVLRVGTEGSGEVVEDNTGAIRAALRDHNEAFAERGGLCSVSHGASGGAPAGILFVLGAIAALVRRRRK